MAAFFDTEPSSATYSHPQSTLITSQKRHLVRLDQTQAALHGCSTLLQSLARPQSRETTTVQQLSH